MTRFVTNNKYILIYNLCTKDNRLSLGDVVQIIDVYMIVYLKRFRLNIQGTTTFKSIERQRQREYNDNNTKNNNNVGHDVPVRTYG